MWRKLILLVCICPVMWDARGQKKEYLSIENNENFDRLSLTLTATSGFCQIRPSHTAGVLNIYGSHENQQFEPNLTASVHDRTHFVNFNLTDNQNLGQALSKHMFGGDNRYINHWDVHLSDNKSLELNLNYVVGEANVDLSGLPVEKLKIKTGNANVLIGYFSGLYNPLAMDTLHAEVELGSLVIDRINLSKASAIVADVGLGSLTMDFGDRHVICTSSVKASVGAGSLHISIPENEYPILIRINNSPLCHVKILKSFKKIEKNVFVNKLYKPNADHLVTFDLDVTLGQIQFTAAK